MSDGKKVVLIATPDNDERNDIITTLSKGGHVTLPANSAEEALEHAKSNTVDVVILDLSSKTHNGYALLESLANDVVLTQIPSVLAIATTKEEIDENKNITLGVKDFVVRSSSTVSDVEEKLHSYLGGGEGDPIHAEGFKILVVEDDNFLRDLLARKLGQENCQFIAAIDGENALKIMDDERPSIVLLDLILPGIDGFEVLSKIRQNPDVKDVPVVILSNLGQDSDIKKAKELGADDFLIKANFSIDEVITKIKELVAK